MDWKNPSVIISVLRIGRLQKFNTISRFNWEMDIEKADCKDGYIPGTENTIHSALLDEATPQHWYVNRVESDAIVIGW